MNVTSHVSIKGNKSLSIDDLACDSNKIVSVADWGDNVTASLLSLKVDKQIYSPNSIKVVMCTNTTDADVCDKIVESLIDGKLTVWYPGKKDDEKMYIAEDYLIHEVTPVQYSASNKYVKIELVAYSPDKMLTYDKYSMAYTTKHLCKDIVPSQLGGVLKDVFCAEQFQADTLHNTANSEGNEIIYPYLMQYNESLYDFLRRVTYRSGEYMYYEGKKLHIGLNVPAKAESIEYDTKYRMGRHAVRSFASHHHNLNDETSLFASEASYNEEYSQEDYANVIEKDPNEAGWAKKTKNWLEVFTDVLSKDNPAEMIEAAGSDIFSGIMEDNSDTDSANKEHNKEYLFELDKKGTEDMYDTKDATAKQYMPYMMYHSKDKLMAAAYNEIRTGEEKISAGMQHLELQVSEYTHVELCQVVTIGKDQKDDSSKTNDSNKTKYVVVRIEREEYSDKDTTNLYNIDVVPLMDDKKNIFPPKQDDIQTVRTVGPQTAFVTSTDDVNGMGRVQVRFHWQEKEGDASPLLRMSSQMASDDAGVRFRPNVNDEVIINFTNGNGDLPYVAGALFNKAHKAPENIRTIRSSHGHSITFDDSGDDEAFGKSMLPLWKSLETYFPSIKTKVKDAEGKKFHTGGVQIADDCGLYNIDMSASKRAITIESPMGNVTINALTGITISAPNGNVKIEGKNIELCAGNNITVKAGENISKWADFKETYSSKEGWGKMGLTVATDVVNGLAGKTLKKIAPAAPIDMKAVRCLMEAFARPVEGTMKLHTENNLMLEAGGEKTTTDMSNMKNLYNQRQLSGNRAKTVAAGVQTINNIFDEISELVKNAAKKKIDAAAKLKAYILKPGTTDKVNDSLKFALDGIYNINPDNVIQAVIDDATGANPKLKYKEEELFAGGPAGTTWDIFKEQAERIFDTTPESKDWHTNSDYTRIRRMMRQLKEMVKLVNNLAAAASLKDLKDKQKELNSYSTWFIGDKTSWGVGLDKGDFKDIGSYVGGMKFHATINKLVTSAGADITQATLREEKRKYLHKIIMNMLKGNGKWPAFCKTLFMGKADDTMALYNDHLGKLPDANTAIADWDNVIDKLEECKGDDSMLATVLNTVGEAALNMIGLGSITGTWNGMKGIFDEAASLSVEAQGNIYLTSKDNGTTKLNNNGLVASQGLNSKFDDIKLSLKKDVVNPLPAAPALP